MATTKADRYATTADIDGQTVKLTCEADGSGQYSYRYRACGRDAHLVEFAAKRVDAARKPLCNIHAGVARRSWSVKNGYDLVVEAIVDDVLAQHARKVEANAIAAVERARKDKEQAERNARYLVARADEAARDYTMTRVDDWKPDYSSDYRTMRYMRVPRWTYQPEGTRSSWDGGNVSFGMDGGQRVIETHISSRLDVNAARALRDALDAALSALDEPTTYISREEYEALPENVID